MFKYTGVFGVMLLASLIAPNSYAVNVDDTYASDWGYNETLANSDYGELMLAGGIGYYPANYGTYGDEAGFVAMLSQKINANGVFLCPYQLQCANKKKKRKSWTEYYLPTGYDVDQCAWFCTSGYTGSGCTQRATGKEPCDNEMALPRRSELAMRTWGGGAGAVENQIVAFNNYSVDGNESDIVLGAVGFVDHGVKVAPIKATCGRQRWSGIDSFVSGVEVVGNTRLLCKQGYQPNSGETGCVPTNSDTCMIQDIDLCAGFEKSLYNSSLHTLEQGDGCYRYFCRDVTMAFTSGTDTTCVDCFSTTHGGSDSATGQCLACETGYIWNGEWGSKGKCVKSMSLSKLELLYGKGQSRSTNPSVMNQCWPIGGANEYIECVKNGGNIATSSSTLARQTRG